MRERRGSIPEELKSQDSPGAESETSSRELSFQV